ncbi:hypothetical protein GCM10009868_16780 [Terrabacter aerolatus]|uniref:Uncharacterized protein n=1 Tax=Terrabacter aerolatus TaxID=422442 RepID=A0A512D2M2_9MICO|nr:hypothetical protein [Terrabacter aerolatus]GEO30500.1 hypothetical protein TAE01_23100 [Terrabacter aerolatus]
MTDPTPQEGYTWPTTPSSPPTTGPDDRPVRPQPSSEGARPVGLTRRQGAVAGGVFALVSVGATVVTGLTLSLGLTVVAMGVAASAVAVALPRLRAFAQGFLVGSVAAAVGGVAALYLFVAVLFTTATLW